MKKFENCTAGTSGDAMNTFPKLVDMDDQTKNEYREALLKYCELDTWAMVEILRRLREIVG